MFALMHLQFDALECLNDTSDEILEKIENLKKNYFAEFFSDDIIEPMTLPNENNNNNSNSNNVNNINDDNVAMIKNNENMNNNNININENTSVYPSFKPQITNDNCFYFHNSFVNQSQTNTNMITKFQF